MSTKVSAGMIACGGGNEIVCRVHLMDGLERSLGFFLCALSDLLV